MGLMRPGTLLFIMTQPSNQERLSLRICIREGNSISVACIWKWNDTIHTIRLGERGVQVSMSMSLEQLVLLRSSLSENVNQMVSDHVRPGHRTQEKASPLFVSAANTSLVTLTLPRACQVAFREEKSKDHIHWFRNLEEEHLPIRCISDNYRDQMLNTTK